LFLYKQVFADDITYYGVEFIFPVPVKIYLQGFRDGPRHIMLKGLRP